MTKRIISVLLALVLVLALAMPVLAEETKYTITINDEAGRTFVAYQIFTGRVEGREGEILLSDIQWGNGITEDGKTAMGGDAEAKAKNLANTNAKDFATYLLENEYVQNPISSAEHNGTAYVFTLEPGYYLIQETTDVSTGKAASGYIVELTEANKVMDPKRSGVPTLTKDQSDTLHATYEVGETITFTIVGTLPTDGYDMYTTYYVEFEDQMSSTLKYVENSEKVTVGGNEVDYFDFTYNDETNELFWECKDVKAKGLEKGTKITVTYDAVLTEDALADAFDKATNKARLEYSNNPDTDGTGFTNWDTEMLFTFDLNGNKVDMADQTALKDAQFVLKKKDVEEYYKWDDTTKKVTWVAEDAADVKTSAADGSFGFNGLGEGEYELVETKAPAGYNSIDPIPVKIVATKVVDDVKVEFEVYVNNAQTPIRTLENVAEETITVENGKGTTLPETGGIGTTIFYLVGGLMMAAAVVLLVAKKRTVNE